MKEISLDLISPSPNPIRKSWDEGKMQELGQSISEQGVIVPIKVRPSQEWIDNCPHMRDSTFPRLCVELEQGAIEKYGWGNWEGSGIEICTYCWVSKNGNHPEESHFDMDEEFPPESFVPYEIVYGHRRVEAAKRTGLKEIPAIVESVEDAPALIQALIENVQREDMEPVEMFNALLLLQQMTGWSKYEIAKRGILSSSRIVDYFKVGNAPKDVQDLVAAPAHDGRLPGGKISQRHIQRISQSGVDDEGYSLVAKKAASQSLSSEESRAVADAYIKADTPELKQEVLEVPGKLGDSGTILRRAKRNLGIEFAKDVEREIKKDHYQELPKIAKTFLDAGRVYEREVDLVRGAINSGVTVFSPEGKDFVTRRINSTISKLEHLMEVINE